MESGLWREWKEVTEETEPLKKTEILRRNIRAQKGQASGLGLLPKIGGVSFDLDSLVAIRQIHERDGVSESHVVRSCAGIGLPVVQDVEIHAQIKRAAERYCTDERQVIQNAVRCGLEQWEWEREWDGPPGSGVAGVPRFGRALESPRSRGADQKSVTPRNGRQGAAARWEVPSPDRWAGLPGRRPSDHSTHQFSRRHFRRACRTNDRRHRNSGVPGSLVEESRRTGGAPERGARENHLLRRPEARAGRSNNTASGGLRTEGSV